jgi:hypothetical protein
MVHKRSLQLVRVSAELKANSERIKQKVEILENAIRATSRVLSWMGPNPESVDLEAIVSEWNELYAIGTFSLMRSATDDFLAAGQIDETGVLTIRDAMSEWYSMGNDLEKQYDLLRVSHANIADYLQDSIPLLHTMSTNSAMTGHPTSKFPFDTDKFLADPAIESRLAIYLIRMEFFTYQALELENRQTDLLAKIQSVAEN